MILNPNKVTLAVEFSGLSILGLLSLALCLYTHEWLLLSVVVATFLIDLRLYTVEGK